MMLMLGQTIRIASTPEAIARILNQIESELFSEDSSRVKYIVRLVLTELMSNAYKHGNQKDPSKWIELKISANRPFFTFEVTDESVGFTLPDFSEETDELSESGRGLKLIHDLSESFEAVNNGKTLKVVLKFNE